MSNQLYDSVARIARHEVAARATAGLGRVVSAFPAEGGTPDHAVTVQMLGTNLVLPRVPLAVGLMGFAAIPAVDELVIVVFLEGDFNAPVVVGRVYHPDQQPPTHKEGEVVVGLPSGQSDPALSLVVTGDPATIKLKLPGEVSLEIVESKVELTVGKLKLSLDGAGGGRAEVAAGGSTITLKSDGDVTVKAVGNLKLEATKVEISGQAGVKISGALVEIN